MIDAALRGASIAAIAVWHASGICARAEYVCVPRSYGGGDSYLVLRTGPGPQYPEIGPMANRTAVTVVNQQGAWDYVRTADGNTGWAANKRICTGTPLPRP